MNKEGLKRTHRLENKGAWRLDIGSERFNGSEGSSGGELESKVFLWKKDFEMKKVAWGWEVEEKRKRWVLWVFDLDFMKGGCLKRRRDCWKGEGFWDLEVQREGPKRGEEERVALGLFWKALFLLERRFCSIFLLNPSFNGRYLRTEDLPLIGGRHEKAAKESL